MRRRMKCAMIPCAGLFITLMIILTLPAFGDDDILLTNGEIGLRWVKQDQGYVLGELTLKKGDQMISAPNTKGAYVALYSRNEPDTTLNNERFEEAQGHVFDEYRYIVSRWRDNFRPVPLNTAGEAISFFPTTALARSNTVEFVHQEENFTAEINWSLDQLYTHDILVEMRIEVKKDGYYSFATPTLFTTSPADMEWAILPGYFQGHELQADLLRAYAYGQGIPAAPVVVRERTASTLSPVIQNKDGITIAVIPEPGLSSDPWYSGADTRAEWRLGLSLMNRDAQLSPTLYHPVLGETDSYMRAGDELSFRFRYTVDHRAWFDVYKHVIYDIYNLEEALKMKNTNQSLSHRIMSMLHYLKDDSLSKWMTYEHKGRLIGAQAYLGGVVGADGDAMKNADYGAMWMLARLTGDSVLNETRLHPARNFKVAQQQQRKGFFQGAAQGQYYLWKAQRFTEEWGDYVEPIGVTYYTMLDIGNILLFQPEDIELQSLLKMGAERLLEWQQDDGSWHVAYDRSAQTPLFTDVLDLRPTFYGLLVAYKLLGDNRYLDAAIRGANWFVEHAVDKGHFLGVCGDVRFVPDFATVQSAQALLDLFDITSDEKYRKAAITAATLYTASIYTHPIVSQKRKEVNGKLHEDWQITQVGLSFEHGGTLGSANGGGPIPLASHAGLFVRMADLTGEQMFRDMARAAAWGRDAFVNPDTHVASYYWTNMNAGAGPFPHHAWWQVGWITDYLMAEIASRSNGAIDFPRGFITPKVGPHQPYGFKPGYVFGESAELWIPVNHIDVDNERVDFMAARKANGQTYVLLLNNSTREERTHILISEDVQGVRNSPISILNEKGDHLESVEVDRGEAILTLPPMALRVVKLNN